MEQERWFRLTLMVLATWRLTHLIAAEDGPGDVIATIRERLGNSFLGKLMDCFYCLSLWIAAPMALCFTTHWKEWLMLWLALSGAACLLERASEPGPGIQISRGED
jgi:Protein of unknown function (DUF1360)